MKLRTFTKIILLTVFSSTVFANETHSCNVKTFAKVLKAVDKVADEKKDMAIAELKKARAKMAEDDAASCSAHLANASDLVAVK